MISSGSLTSFDELVHHVERGAVVATLLVEPRQRVERLHLVAVHRQGVQVAVDGAIDVLELAREDLADGLVERIFSMRSGVAWTCRS
jgi:hypothetical protein